MRSEEHTSELQSHSEISYAVFCLKKKKEKNRKKGIEGMTDEQKKTKKETERHLSSSLHVIFDCLDIYMSYIFFFFNDTATTEIYTNLNTLSLHDALPIYSSHIQKSRMPSSACDWSRSEEHTSELQSHSEISYAVFCLKK